MSKVKRCQEALPSQMQPPMSTRSRLLRENESIISMNGSPLMLPSKLFASGPTTPAAETPALKRSMRLSIRPSLAPGYRASIAPPHGLGADVALSAAEDPTHQDDVIVTLSDLKNLQALEDLRDRPVAERQQAAQDIMALQAQLANLLAQINA